MIRSGNRPVQTRIMEILLCAKQLHMSNEQSPALHKYPVQPMIILRFLPDPPLLPEELP